MLIDHSLRNEEKAGPSADSVGDKLIMLKPEILKRWEIFELDQTYKTLTYARDKLLKSGLEDIERRLESQELLDFIREHFEDESKIVQEKCGGEACRD